MAWANVRTYGLLDRWRNRLIQQPYPFQQVNDGYANYAPQVWVQQERNELAQTILSEIEQFNFWVGYAPFPIQFEEVVHLDTNRAWYNQTLRVDSGKLIQFGKEALERIGIADVTYSNDVATITLNGVAPITDGRIAFVFTANDSSSEAGDLRYEITDLQVKHTGIGYVATGHKSLFVSPLKQSIADSFVNGNPQQRNQLLKTEPLNFVTLVDVYRVYTDTTVQASLLSVDSVTGTVVESNITPIITDAKLGEFRLGTGTGSFGTAYAVKVYYKAGHELQRDGNVYTPFENILIRRAKVNLPISVLQVSYRVSANWEKDSINIFDISTPHTYANPVGDKLIDFYTWQTYQIYHDKLRGEARRFV